MMAGLVEHIRAGLVERKDRILRESIVVRVAMVLGLCLFVLVVTPIVLLLLIVLAQVWIPLLACWLAWKSFCILTGR